MYVYSLNKTPCFTVSFLETADQSGRVKTDISVDRLAVDDETAVKQIEDDRQLLTGGAARAYAEQ